MSKINSFQSSFENYKTIIQTVVINMEYILECGEILLVTKNFIQVLSNSKIVFDAFSLVTDLKIKFYQWNENLITAVTRHMKSWIIIHESITELVTCDYRHPVASSALDCIQQLFKKSGHAPSTTA